MTKLFLNASKNMFCFFSLHRIEKLCIQRNIQDLSRCPLYLTPKADPSISSEACSDMQHSSYLWVFHLPATIADKKKAIIRRNKAGLVFGFFSIDIILPWTLDSAEYIQGWCSARDWERSGLLGGIPRVLGQMSALTLKGPLQVYAQPMLPGKTPV